jgi:FkbM family methyltransferase
MSITGSIKRLLYRRLSLENYLKVLSRGFFAGYGLGLGKNSPDYEYPRFLKHLVRRGDTVLDIGANLGYYSRILSGLVGAEGRVYAVEPVKPILGVLKHNLRRCRNVEIAPYALGGEDKHVTMVNDSSRYTGYMGTGRNYIPETEEQERDNLDMEFQVEMRRGSELFAGLERLDFVKCDIEGYESVVIPEMASVIQKHLPVVLLETGGANRRPMIELFRRWGYAGYVLHKGRLVSVMRAPEKDVLFIPGHRHKELICE